MNKVALLQLIFLVMLAVTVVTLATMMIWRARQQKNQPPQSPPLPPDRDAPAAPAAPVAPPEPVAPAVPAVPSAPAAPPVPPVVPGPDNPVPAYADEDMTIGQRVPLQPPVVPEPDSPVPAYADEDMTIGQRVPLQPPTEDADDLMDLTISMARQPVPPQPEPEPEPAQEPDFSDVSEETVRVRIPAEQPLPIDDPEETIAPSLFRKKACLLFSVDDGEGQREEEISFRERMEIGRDGECELHLAQRYVSRHHLCIHHANGLMMIENLSAEKTGNYTLLNGAEMGPEPVPLHDGDVLEIAEIRIRIRLSNS